MKKSIIVFLFMFSAVIAFSQETEINGCYITHYTWGKLSSHSFEAYGNVYVETDPKEPLI